MQVVASHYTENAIKTFKVYMASMRREALLYLSARNILLKCEIYSIFLSMVRWSFVIQQSPCNLHIKQPENDALDATETTLSAWVSQFVHNLYQKARGNVKTLRDRHITQLKTSDHKNAGFGKKQQLKISGIYLTFSGISPKVWTTKVNVIYFEVKYNVN